MIHSLACDYERLALVLACTLFLSFQIRALVRAIKSAEENIKMAILDSMKAEVKATTQFKAAIKLAFDSLSAKLAEMASRETVDPDELQALADELHSDNTDFAALITANTASAPSLDGATSNTASPAPADLPDGHPLKPAAEAPPADEPTPVA